MEMNDEWAFVLQIISRCGLPSHCICICNGVIYDANSTTTLPKTLANLHLCAQLHIPGRADHFYCTKWIRRLIPQNMILKKQSQVGYGITKKRWMEQRGSTKKMCYLLSANSTKRIFQNTVAESKS